ncbi:preprotein translocase subunit Sec61beta [Candidatus Woesearchaeota archaeon]|nr:preprotein translocase subunit Sec61beta [Candidatus Woesearchaeota archaeon]
MSQDNKIRLPSGQGGLTRYFDEYSSKIEISPMSVVIMAVAVMVIIMALHYYGSQLFG